MSKTHRRLGLRESSTAFLDRCGRVRLPHDLIEQQLANQFNTPRLKTV